MVTEPQVLVCDEPTTLLDLRNADRIAAMLLALPQQVVLVTHQLDLVLDYQRVIVMDEGRVVFDGDAHQAVQHYQQLMRAIGRTAGRCDVIGLYRPGTRRCTAARPA